MQQLLIWLGVGVLVLAIFIPYFLQFRTGQKMVMERKKEAQAMGIDRPRAQYPMINRSLCIGCGSCVEACPEGDVIGVVWGVAEVINGERCVGHGYCETACPVGALKVGLGDVTNRPDIPILTPYHETTVAGLFIAGELGGLSLIRNAITQGSVVVEEIARRNVRGPDNALDLIIVGAGPAGMSAALAAVQHNLTYLVLDEKAVGGTILHYPRQKLVMTQPVEIPLYGRLKAEEYSKEALMEMWHTIIAEFKINIRTGERVETVRKRDNLFEIAVGDRTYYARQVVLAMGRRGSPRRMEVPGEELPKVLYQLIDAQSFRGKKMLVVGGGDSAVEAAVGLARQQGNVVTISYRKSSFFRVKKKNEDAITKLIADKKILPLFDSQILEVRPQSVVLSTKQGEREIPNDFVIVQIGGIPPFEMLKSMGIAFGGEQRSMKEIAAGTPLPVHT
jgi:putative YpdA family bacillithiol system oxidoreductase